MNQPDIIGTIYKPTGKMLTDADGNQYPETTPVDGFHVNFQEEVAELADYKMDPQPTTPIRVYAGNIMPVAYKFPDEATFRQYFPKPEDVAPF